MRNVQENPTPLDYASFYIEALKYGAGPGTLEPVTREQQAEIFDKLLQRVGVPSMTGTELVEATEFYGEAFASALRMSPVVAESIFIDGVMHGIALAGGLEGQLREPIEQENNGRT